MSSRHKLFDSHSIIPPEAESDDNDTQTENSDESSQDRTFVELNTNPSEMHNKIYCQSQNLIVDIITGQVNTSSVELQPQLSEVYSLVQAQGGNGRSRLKHQKMTEAANKLLRKQELKRNHLFQKMIQSDTVFQDDNLFLESTQIYSSPSKKYHNNKLSVLDFQFLHHIFFMSSQKDKKLRMLLNLLKTLYLNQQHPCLFERHCKDIYSFPLIREHHDSHLYNIDYKIYESSVADIPFTVAFNPVLSNNFGIFSKTKDPKGIYLPIRDPFVYFPNKIQEANGFFRKTNCCFLFD